MRKLKFWSSSLIVLLFFNISCSNPSSIASKEKNIEGNLENSKSLSEIKIGKQVWCSKNLDVTKFSNGDPIKFAETAEEWEIALKNNEPAWRNYDNDPKNGEKYGKLYNWYAVNDKRGLAPQGWHIPLDNEWQELIDCLGGVEIAGKKLKSTIEWIDYKNGTNESGFAALPGGNCSGNGSFFLIGKYGGWWCANESDSEHAYFCFMANNITASRIKKKAGLSVRCIKN